MLNLCDTNITNPLKLKGKKFDYSSCFDKDGTKFDVSRSSLISSIVAYYFYDYHLASKLIKVCKPLKGYLQNGIAIPIFYFYEG